VTDNELLGVVLYCLISGLLFSTLGWRVFREFRAYARLKASGKIAQAAIARMEIKQWRLRRYHYVTYSYGAPQPGGKVSIVLRRQQVSGDHYNKLATGDKVTVCYLPDAPGVGRLWSNNRDTTAREEMLIDLGATLVVALLVSGAFLPHRWFMLRR
jgi:hypothetical protein